MLFISNFVSIAIGFRMPFYIPHVHYVVSSCFTYVIHMRWPRRLKSIRQGSLAIFLGWNQRHIRMSFCNCHAVCYFRVLKVLREQARNMRSTCYQSVIDMLRTPPTPMIKPYVSRMPRICFQDVIDRLPLFCRSVMLPLSMRYPYCMYALSIYHGSSAACCQYATNMQLTNYTHGRCVG